MSAEDLPKVMRIITRLNVGGPARHAVLLTEALEGFRSELISGWESSTEGRIYPTVGDHFRVPWLKRDLDPVADIHATRTLARMMRRGRPQIVHTHLAKAGALGRFAAHRADVPVIIHTFHGHVLRGYFGRASTHAFVAIERALSRHTDALIAVSSEIRDELLELGIGHPTKWHVMPIGLDLRHLGRVQRSSEARSRLGLPATRPTVGMVARLVPIKDHSTFLQAAALVKAKLPEVTFVVAGDGELREKLEKEARSLLGNDVYFLGWVHDLVTLYGALDAVVLTSRNEGTPVALIEAAAASLPVVATRVGGVQEVVKDETTGFLVAAGRPDLLAARLIQVVENPGMARSMGALARKSVVNRFSKERLIANMRDLYDGLLP